MCVYTLLALFVNLAYDTFSSIKSLKHFPNETRGNKCTLKLTFNNLERKFTSRAFDVTNWIKFCVFLKLKETRVREEREKSITFCYFVNWPIPI